MERREFERIIPKICDATTSSDSGNWGKGNPLYGHCAIVSLLAQELFGGFLLRGSLENTPYSLMRSHYWNHFIDREWDFTRKQFKKGYPKFKVSEARTRDYVLSNVDTQDRYNLLIARFNDRAGLRLPLQGFDPSNTHKW